MDPSEYELYKENDVLYPTLATLPHLDLDCPVRLAVMGAREVGKSALAVRYRKLKFRLSKAVPHASAHSNIQ